jgi:hypothetical protein
MTSSAWRSHATGPPQAPPEAQRNHSIVQSTGYTLQVPKCDVT